MKTLLITIGSRGDIEPFIALGKGLARNGHDVHVCTALRFKEVVESHGLGFKPLSNDIFELADGGVMEQMGSLFSAVKTIYRLNKIAKPINKQLIVDTIQAGLDIEPNLMVFHPKALGAVSIAEKLQIPAVMATLQPMYVATGDFPPAGLPDWGHWWNRMSYKLIDLGYNQYLAELNELRHTLLQLPKLTKRSGPFYRSSQEPMPVLHAFSRYLVTRPDDWPNHAMICGNWSLTAETDKYKPSQDLIEFLEDGEPPVYIGFGSMKGSNPQQKMVTIIESVTRANLRAVIATGWGGLKADEVPDNILVIDGAPHSWLLPRVSAVVHHGGAGTTIAGLKAGKPTLICPFFGDQPFWGAMVARRKLGPKPIKQKKLSVATLTPALVELTTNTEYQLNAAELAKQLESDKGVDNAVEWLESRYLSS